MDYLDEGFLTEILLRLPAMSLLRFKCVNRLWHSVISDPAFAKAQLRMSLRGNPHLSEKLLVPANSEDLDESIFTSLHNQVTDRYGCFSMVGSCHGLVCLQVPDDWRQFFVYNPTTRELRQLPKSDSLRYPDRFGYTGFVCGFGYDSRKDDYKLLVRYRYSDEQPKLVEIYSLRSNSWRSITEVNDYLLLEHATYSNGFLHFVNRTFADDPTIVSFNISTEEFHEAMLPVPPFKLRHETFQLSFTGGGSLIVYIIDPPKAEVWIMKDCGLNSTWRELCHFSHEWLTKWNEWFMEVPSWIQLDSMYTLTTAGKTLLCVRGGWYSVDIYDPMDGSLKKTWPHPDARFRITTYVESLVSVRVADRPPKKARLSM